MLEEKVERPSIQADINRLALFAGHTHFPICCALNNMTILVRTSSHDLIIVKSAPAKHLHSSLRMASPTPAPSDRCRSSSLQLYSHDIKPYQELDVAIEGNTRLEWFILFSLVYGNFWTAACVSIQAPFFPKEAELKGASPSEYGLVFGIYEVMILTTAPLFARLVCKYSALSMCKLGLLASGLSVVLFGVVLDRLPPGGAFIYMAFLIRIMEGLAASAFMTTSYTVAAAIFKSTVATVFSYLEVAFGLGLIVGPTIGGALYELGGFSFPFTFTGGFLFLGFFVLQFCARNCRSNDFTSKQKQPSVISFICDRVILFDSLAIITALTLIGFNAATLEPHIRQFELSPFLTGLVFVINGTIYATTTPIWGKLCHMKINPKMLIVLGYFLCSLGLIILGPLSFVPLESSMFLVIVSLVLIGLGIAAKLVCSFVDAINNSIQLRGMPNDVGTYGLVSAMFFTSCSTGASIGPLVGGFLLEHLGYRPSTIVVFSIEAFMTVVGLVYIFMAKFNHRKSYASL